MKLKYFRVNLGNVIDPNKVYTADKPIVLDHHPVKPNEGATKGYVDAKEKEFYEDGINKLVISNVNVLPIEGPDIKHHPDMKLTVNARPDLKENLAGVLADVDDKGRIVKFHQLQASDIDANVKVDWDDISNKPDTLEGYKIKDLVSANKNQLVTGKTTIALPPVHQTSPIPYSHLQTIWDDSGYEMNVGDVIIKLGPVNKNMYTLADGREINYDLFPEYSHGAIFNEETGKVLLPDCRIRDNYLLNSFGVQGRSYVKVRSVDVKDMFVKIEKIDTDGRAKTATVHVSVKIVDSKNKPYNRANLVIKSFVDDLPSNPRGNIKWVGGSQENSYDGEKYRFTISYNESTSGKPGYFFHEELIISESKSHIDKQLLLDGDKYPIPPINSLPADPSKTLLKLVFKSSGGFGGIGALKKRHFFVDLTLKDELGRPITNRNFKCRIYDHWNSRYNSGYEPIITLTRPSGDRDYYTIKMKANVYLARSGHNAMIGSGYVTVWDAETGVKYGNTNSAISGYHYEPSYGGGGGT